jgi:hypothetical protein
MRPFITAIRTAAFAAIAIGLASQPALAQTAPPSTGAGADLVGGADNPYNDLGITASESDGLGTILSGQDLDMGLAALMDHQSPPSVSPVTPSLFDDQVNLAPLRDAPSDGAASEGANADDTAEDNGMSADQYADHLDNNADAWDDLADNAADPADAAEWRKHAKDLRAEAARARARAARDQAQQQAQSMAVDNAVSVAINNVGQHIRPQTGMHAAQNAARAGSHAAARAATPHIEVPRLVIAVGPSMMHY